MRALVNLFFLLLVCAAVALVSYLYGQTGKPVPYVSEQIEKFIPVSARASDSNGEELQTLLAQRTTQVQRLQEGAQQRDQAIDTLQTQLRDAQQRAQAAAAAGSTGGGGADPAFVQSLEENNQFLTDELTRMSVENADLQAQVQNAQANANAAPAAGGVDDQQIAAIQTQLQQVVAERTQLSEQLTAAQDRISQLVSSGELPEADGAQLQQLQQQVQQLAGDRQQLIAQLTQVAGQRDQVIAQLNAIGGQLQQQGVDVNQLFAAAQQSLQNRAQQQQAAQAEGGGEAAPAAAAAAEQTPAAAEGN